MALEETGRLAKKSGYAVVISPSDPGRRYFTLGSVSEEEGMIEASGYYQQDCALILLPDGRGVYGKSRASGGSDGHFFLPRLPEGFVYSGIVSAGAPGSEAPDSSLVIIASWEERQDWNIGAAGFLMLEIEL
jgi:hypothetical protein